MVTNLNQYCGVGWIMDPPSPSFENNAYSVVSAGCIQSVTMAHEMGHNMEMAHDRCNSDGTAAFTYSYGYRQCGTNNDFSTIMAYDCNYCSSCSQAECPVGNAPRILYFSNPSISVAGQPIGVSDTSVNSAYNAQTLTQTQIIVANFRASNPGN